MQKKIIALAVASALTVPAMAFAEATITGQVNMSYDSVNDGVVAGSTTTNQLVSNQSRLQFKGSEDLGGGLAAIWQLDSRFNVDTGTISGSTLFGGNNYLGLKSDTAGTLMAGRIDAPYKSAMRSLDVFYDVAGDNRAGVGNPGGLLTHDVRLSNALAYMSPSMSGFSVALATVFGAESATQTPGNSKKGSAYSLAAMYSMDAIYAALGYQTVKYGDIGTGDLGASTAPPPAVDDEDTSISLGGGYKTDQFVVNARYEQATNKTALTGFDSKGSNWYIGGKFNFTPTDDVRLAYTKRGSTTGATNDANQYALGYEHMMSKATSVYATYVKTSDNTLNAADPSAISLGMKHSF